MALAAIGVMVVLVLNELIDSVMDEKEVGNFSRAISIKVELVM